MARDAKSALAPVFDASDHADAGHPGMTRKKILSWPPLVGDWRSMGAPVLSLLLLLAASFQGNRIGCLRTVGYHRITRRRGIGPGQRHGDNPGRQDQTHEGVCLEPAVERALVFVGQHLVAFETHSFCHAPIPLPNGGSMLEPA